MTEKIFKCTQNYLFTLCVLYCDTAAKWVYPITNEIYLIDRKSWIKLFNNKWIGMSFLWYQKFIEVVPKELLFKWESSSPHTYQGLQTLYSLQLYCPFDLANFPVGKKKNMDSLLSNISYFVTGSQKKKWTIHQKLKPKLLSLYQPC